MGREDHAEQRQAGVPRAAGVGPWTQNAIILVGLHPVGWLACTGEGADGLSTAGGLDSGCATNDIGAKCKTPRRTKKKNHPSTTKRKRIPTTHASPLPHTPGSDRAVLGNLRGGGGLLRRPKKAGGWEMAACFPQLPLHSPSFIPFIESSDLNGKRELLGLRGGEGAPRAPNYDWTSALTSPLPGDEVAEREGGSCHRP